MVVQVAHAVHAHAHAFAPAPSNVHRRAERHERVRESQVKAQRAPPRLLFKVGGAPSTSTAPALPVSGQAQLPRKLRRPEPTELDAFHAGMVVPRLREALGRLAPELMDLPREFIREAYSQNTQELMHACASVKPLVESRRTGLGVPKRIPIAIADASIDTSNLPTHFLAVSSASPTTKQPIKDRTISLYPVHAITLLSTCSPARLPYLPTSQPQSQSETAVQTLPTVPLALPHPRSFPALISFLYTQSAHTLLPSLLPLAPSQLDAHFQLRDVPSDSGMVLAGVLARDPASCRAYTTHVANALDAGALLSHALFVHGVWENACVLGVDLDAPTRATGGEREEQMSLGSALELAWEVVIGAIAVQKARGQSA